MEREELEQGDLGGVALGGRNADLRAGSCVKHAVCLTCQQRVDHVGQGNGLGTAALCLAQRVERVDGLPGLADGHDERLLAENRVPVAELARDLDLSRHPGPALEGYPTAQASVEGRAAADQHHPLDPVELGLGEPEVLELGRAVGVNPPHEGVCECSRLLMDLFRHEVVISVASRGDEIPSDPEGLELTLSAVETDDRDRTGPDLGDLVIRELVQRPGSPEECRYVGRDKAYPIDLSQDEWRRPSCRRDHLRLVGAHGREREVTAKLGHAASQRLGEAGPICELPLEQVGDDLGIGLGGPCVALDGQLLPELLVVLDDAVVHDRHAAGAVAMRVGVALDRGPMGRPARMTYAGAHVSRRAGGCLPQCLQRVAPHGVALSPQAVVADEDDPRRVIAAVLQESQGVQHHLQRVGRAGDPDDSAHA